MKGYIFLPLVPPFCCYWGTIEEVATTVSLNQDLCEVQLQNMCSAFLLKMCSIKTTFFPQSRVMKVYMSLLELSKFCLWGKGCKWKWWLRTTRPSWEMPVADGWLSCASWGKSQADDNDQNAAVRSQQLLGWCLVEAEGVVRYFYWPQTWKWHLVSFNWIKDWDLIKNY